MQKSALYRSARKLSRRDVAYIRASSLSPKILAIILSVKPDCIRKIRRGDRAASVPAYVIPSRPYSTTAKEILYVCSFVSRLLKELQCEVLKHQLGPWLTEAKVDGQPACENELFDPATRPKNFNSLREMMYRKWGQFS